MNKASPDAEALLPYEVESLQSLTDRYALVISAMQRHEQGAREQALRLASEIRRHPANDVGRLSA